MPVLFRPSSTSTHVSKCGSSAVYRAKWLVNQHPVSSLREEDHRQIHLKEAVSAYSFHPSYRFLLRMSSALYIPVVERTGDFLLLP
jgi:hypothetical protein